MKILRKKSGFTLIELLIVMLIIAILATLGIVAYSGATQNARNAKRIGHLNSMQSAFEQWYTARGSYSTCSAMAANLEGGVIPDDPSTNNPYTNLQCSTTAYCICASLEGTNPNGANATGRSGTTCSFGDGSMYCVQNKQ